MYRICRNKRPERLIFCKNNKNSKNRRFCVLPPLKTHPSNPLVLCTPPFEKSLFLVGAYFGVGVCFGKYGNSKQKDIDEKWIFHKHVISYIMRGLPVTIIAVIYYYCVVNSEKILWENFARKNISVWFVTTWTTLVADCGKALCRFCSFWIEIRSKFSPEYGSKNRISKFVQMRSLLVLD